MGGEAEIAQRVGEADAPVGVVGRLQRARQSDGLLEAGAGRLVAPEGVERLADAADLDRDLGVLVAAERRALQGERLLVVHQRLLVVGVRLGLPAELEERVAQVALDGAERRVDRAAAGGALEQVHRDAEVGRGPRAVVERHLRAAETVQRPRERRAVVGQAALERQRLLQMGVRRGQVAEELLGLAEVGEAWGEPDRVGRRVRAQQREEALQAVAHRGHVLLGPGAVRPVEQRGGVESIGGVVVDVVAQDRACGDGCVHGTSYWLRYSWDGRCRSSTKGERFGFVAGEARRLRARRRGERITIAR